jgi:hypothetical protein
MLSAADDSDETVRRWVEHALVNLVDLHSNIAEILVARQTDVVGARAQAVINRALSRIHRIQASA